MRACATCSKPLPEQHGRGRPRKYCSGQCRARHYMASHVNISTEQVIAEWGSTCYLCNEPVDLAEPFGPMMANIDHVIPLSKGGITDISNLRLVHYICNLRKHVNYVCPHCAKPI